MPQSQRLTCLLVVAGFFILTGLVLVLFFFPVPAPGNLQQRQWQLISVETTEGSVLWTPAPGAFTLEFQGYTVRGRAICNTYQGEASSHWLVQSMTISWTFSTLMGCLPQAGQDSNSESDFYQALASVRTYALRANRLYLYFDHSTKVLIFS